MRCPTHLSTGQEAIAAGVCFNLKKDDFVLSTHRSHGHYIAKGGKINKLIAEIYGKSTGCSKGKGGSMHLTDLEEGFIGSTAIVGGTIPIGVGIGLSIEIKKTDQICVIFFGDGATEEGVFYESINFAALKKLPVLFICENNLYSVYSPLNVRQPEGRMIYKMVEAMGIPTDYVDGNQILEINEKVKSVIDGIRKGNGPFFLELSTYRWREHCGHLFDNDIGYRSEDEFLKWKDSDPILLLEKNLLGSNQIAPEEIIKIENEIMLEIKNAFDYAEKSPFPSPEEVSVGLFSD